MYGWKVVGRSPLPYSWIGIGLVVLMLGASAGNVKNSVIGAESQREIIERAARAGDYEMARKLYESNYELRITNNGVLGAESALEELVYPEQKLAREIKQWEEALTKYPGNREIMRGLAALYEQAGSQELAAELREQVRILDPNE